MSINPFNIRAPKNGDLGIMHEVDDFLHMRPGAYTPCRGEQLLTDQSRVLPIEPPYYSATKEDAPALTIAASISRDPPFHDIPVDSPTTATPCVAPYDWEAAVASRTLILDTIPDALASDEEKALPGYVANPGLYLSSKSADAALLWTYATTGSTPADPHPALRPGQTRYSFPDVAKVGTDFSDKPFLPNPLTNGTLKICAYKRGYLLSSIPSYSILVKIGRAKATWNKTAQTLTLETTQTSGTTIKYTLNGGPLTIYSGPISITDTTTVIWYAEKTNLITSDSWTTYIKYQDAMPPNDFETIYFSSLPVFDNSSISLEVQLQRQPAFYVSASGSGNGETPSTPGSVASIIGTGPAPNLGKARANRILTASRSGGTLTLTFGGADPVVSGSTGTAKLKYAYSQTEIGASAIAAGDQCEIKTVGDTDWIAIGASANTVGIEFVATGAGTGTGTALRWDWNTYSIPVVVGTGRVLLRIDRQDDTPYSRDFWLGAGVNSQIFTQPADIVWLAGYDDGTIYATRPVGTCILRGGYSAAFNERKAKILKTTFKGAESAVLDGIWNSVTNAGGVIYRLKAATIYNCHTSGEMTPTSGTISATLMEGTCYYCSAYVTNNGGRDISLIAINGSGNDCNLDLVITGANGTSASRDSVAEINLGTLIGGELDVSLVGGDGFDASISDPKYGGAASAIITGSLYGAVTGTISCGSGNGGDSYVADDMGIAGSSTAEINLDGCLGSGSNLQINLFSGDGGDSLNPGGMEDYQSDSIAKCRIVVGNGGLAEINAASGDAGGYGSNEFGLAGASACMVSAYVTGGNLSAALAHGASGHDGYNGDPAESFSAFRNDYEPTYLEAGSLVLSGIDLAGDGYYGAPNSGGGAPSSYYRDFFLGPPGMYFGWYSGTPNGDGAPLSGYEIPQGSGVALGNYWE